MRNNRFMIYILSIFSVLLLLIGIDPRQTHAVAHDPNDQNYDYQLRFWEDRQPDIGFYINAAARHTFETVPDPNMGTISGEWSVMNLLRGMYTGYDYINTLDTYENNSGKEKYFTDYMKRIEDYVVIKQGNLDRNKSTEWSRLILSLSALDYDISDVSGFDFIDRLSSSHRFSHRQGINGPIWEIIAMNTGRYEFYPSPSEDANTYGKMIDYILDREIKQNDGTLGGWALASFGNPQPDPDITGMALQALASYYGNKEKYEQTGAETPFEDFEAAVERGIYILSVIQAENGAFKAFGNVNAESTVQVIVALTELGIDPLLNNVYLSRIDKTASFVTEGAVQDGVWTNNMIDALLTFWADGSRSELGVGGFKHVTTGFDGGGDSGYGVNAMATDQSLYGLIAYDRFTKGENTLYDMTDMMKAHGGTTYTDMKARELNIHYIGLQDKEINVETASPYGIVEIPENDPITGKEFKNWNSQNDGSGSSYEALEKLSMPNHDISLYAQYENIEYDIMFELNGGTFIGQHVPKEYTVEDEVLLPTLKQIEKEGFEFDGWYDNPQLKGIEVTVISEGSTGDKTFYAKWVEQTEGDEEAIKAVEEMIDQLPGKNELALEDKEALENARDAYQALTPIEQDQVKNYSKLMELEEKLRQLIEEEQDRIASEKVTNLIEELPTADNLTLNDRELVEKARLAYENLTKNQQALVLNLDVLLQLEEVLQHLQDTYDAERAQEVDDMIIELPTVEDLVLEDKESVEEVREAFYRLTLEQQELVENKQKFHDIEDRMFELEEIAKDLIEADKVEKMIAGLPKVEDINMNDQANVQQVRKAFDNLTKQQQDLVSNMEVLEVIEARIQEIEKRMNDQKAASNVDEMINNLPDVHLVTIQDKELVESIMKEYESLTESQQKLVENKEKLDQLRTKLTELEEQIEKEDKKAIDQVEEKINGLPHIDHIKVQDKKKIELARKAYNDLTEDQKNRITNIEKLHLAEKKIQQLEQEEIDKESALEVETKIEVLPLVTDIKLSDKDAVEAARKAYDRLTESQKQFVTNIEKLIALEEKIKELEKENVKKPQKQQENDRTGGGKTSEGIKSPSEKTNKIADNNDSTNKKAEKEKHEKLPGTATNIFNVFAIGLIVIIVGSIIYFVSRKRKA
ncbi:InlB B-repeat-containing protein [Pseudogracilibacillus auburnensis]|uniref:Putative repeat protein (TIGR02543 family) n=1 Tax=Pseudogracilibacillus auburnensis TaxID=1494959 RepID=A0A2V3VJM7_9BACI|nr:InlB B-repeat-containing protein [Pseudogracilibacillus auburnensis]PXW80998.1 putative repeat protein (TIGR02543 family) [Pseudogracilibacillus auburnensis]